MIFHYLLDEDPSNLLTENYSPHFDQNSFFINLESPGQFEFFHACYENFPSPRSQKFLILDLSLLQLSSVGTTVSIFIFGQFSVVLYFASLYISGLTSLTTKLLLFQMLADKPFNSYIIRASLTSSRPYSYQLHGLLLLPKELNFN